VNLLTLHLWVGFVVVVLAVLAVWQRPGRRITLYVVTLQFLLGIVLLVEGLKVPWYHYGLAVLAWAGYMAANAMGRGNAGRRTILLVTAISSLLLLIAFAIGQAAVRAGMTGAA
jgi:hypothetical protein